MKLYLAPLLLSIAAGCSRPASPAKLYADAEEVRLHGLTGRAIEIADRGWQRWKGQPNTEWHWKFRLLKAELLFNQGLGRLTLKLLESGGATPPSSELRARYLADLGQAKRDPALLDQAFQLASRQADSPLIPTIELKRAAIADPMRAEGFLQLALIAARARADRYAEVSALLDLGYRRLYRSRFDEAIPWLEQAEAAARRVHADRLRGRALGNLGWCYYQLGDFDRALHSLTEAIALAREVEDDDILYKWLNDIGTLHYRLNELGEAVSNYQTSADLARRMNNPDWLAVALNNLAATSLDVGDVSSAERFNDESRSLLANGKANDSLLYFQLHKASIEAGKNRPAEAEASFRALIDSAGQKDRPYLRWAAKGRLAQLLHSEGRDAEADSEYRGALDTIEREWSNLGEDRHKVTFLAQLIRFYGDYVDFLVARGQTARAAGIADASRARVLAEKLGSEPGPELMRTRTPPGGPILLSYWLAPQRSYLWLIGPDGLRQFTLPGEARIAGLVSQYSAAIERGHDPLERDNPAGRLLYKILIAPARASIPAGASVIVVPDGCLHGLNFETLIVDDPAPHYWIEDVTVAVAPALSLLQERRPRRASPGKLLFIGDPEAADPAFPPLPHLKEEAGIVARHFHGPSLTMLTGRQAQPHAYQAAGAGDYAWIHFAAHAVANAESPLNSAIILSGTGADYKLYAKDVIDQPIQADVVTVSACRGAGAKSYPGEGLLGFTWAFLRSGARNVVAGLWNADDAATAELMAEFYGSLASGARPAVALHRAKLALLKSGGLSRRPYYWGPLQVYTREF